MASIANASSLPRTLKHHQKEISVSKELNENQSGRKPNTLKKRIKLRNTYLDSRSSPFLIANSLEFLRRVPLFTSQRVALVFLAWILGLEYGLVKVKGLGKAK